MIEYTKMNKISLLFDDTELTAELPFENCTIITPKTVQPREKATAIVLKSFTHPLFTQEKFKNDLDFKDKKIGIAINDQTRPLPHAVLLPSLLKYLQEHHVVRENITFFIATGTHRQLTKEEILQVLPGNLASDYRYVTHDCDNYANLVFLGETNKQTPVFVNKRYYQSDIKIVVGNIEPHHFMGFSGGMKTASIGLTGRATIEKNHSMLVHPLAKMGLFMKNPMRADVEEIGCMIGVNYALNVVLNDKKEIINAYWGDPYLVMQKGIPDSLATCQLDMNSADCQYDLVIASAGGYPKDINLYQAQKAITNACLFSKQNGVIILVAGCRNGAGNQKFIQFMRNKHDWSEVIQDFNSQPFKIGPHKAFQLAIQAETHKIILVSRIPDEEVKKYLLTPAQDLPSAIKLAKTYLSEICRVAVLPFATHSMPRMDMS
jgi:nickel-dependent lactate racemase